MLVRVLGDEAPPRRTDELEEPVADEATIRALRRELEQELGRAARRSEAAGADAHRAPPS
ncbi:MAG TPA: hypothetical protein VE528_05060 [Thermoleophilaceae bacterium]|nr:hypothetical protein [Thermoleophilaceae bacterium]